MNLVQLRAAVAAALVTAGAMAHAAVDTTAIEAAGADVAEVGAAVFLVAVAIKVFKWVRRAL
jgi:isochorismate hydrolase